jgi:DNA-binding XRE family transcriptional regulator
MPKPKPYLSEEFAIVLQRMRKAKLLSRQALAEKAGLHQTAVGLIERGLRKPNLDTAYALAWALDLQLSDMIREAETLMTQRLEAGSIRK